MKPLILVSTVLAALYLPFNAQAYGSVQTDSCDLELNNALSVSPQHILIKDEDETLIDIYKDEMVFVRGELMELNSEQQRLVSDYSNRIRLAIPEIGGIAIEAVDIAYQGIQAAFGPASENAKLDAKFDEIKRKIKLRYENGDGHFSFSDGEFNHHIDGDGIDESIEEIMEEMIPTLIGGFISNIGNAIANGESSFEDLENLGDRVEREVEARADNIEIRANKFCDSLKSVDDIEAQLVASNLKFIHFDLLNIKSN